MPGRRSLEALTCYALFFTALFLPDVATGLSLGGGAAAVVSTFAFCAIACLAVEVIQSWYVETPRRYEAGVRRHFPVQSYPLLARLARLTLPPLPPVRFLLLLWGWAAASTCTAALTKPRG